jgi:hypothetical protein
LLSNRGEGKVSSIFDRALHQDTDTINLVLSLRDAVGVPLPDEGVLRDSIKSRRCRICLLRGGRSTVNAGGSVISSEGSELEETTAQTPRGWARQKSNSSSASGFVGNQHIVPAAWSENYEDVWTFSRATTKTGNKKFIVRVSASFNQAENVFLLIELTCTAKKSKDSPRSEMSCGWCCVPISDLVNTNGPTILKKTYSLCGKFCILFPPLVIIYIVNSNIIITFERRFHGGYNRYQSK